MSLINVTATGCELAELRPYPAVASTDSSVTITPVVGPDGKTTYDVSATLTVTKQPLYEYRDIWAEESGALNQGSAEWSFGNGATGYMGLPIDDGWQVVSMYFQADTYAATAQVQVDLMDYGNVASSAASNTISSISLSNATDGGGTTNNAYKYTDYPTPIPVIGPDSVLGFITRTKVGNISDARVGVRLRRQIGEYVSDVSL